MTLPPPYHLVFTLGVVWGLAWVIADSKISLPFRRFIAETTGEDGWPVRLLECPACLSFWLGLGAGGFLHMGFWGAIALGLFACGISIVLAALTIGVNHRE